MPTFQVLPGEAVGQPVHHDLQAGQQCHVRLAEAAAQQMVLQSEPHERLLSMAMHPTKEWVNADDCIRSTDSA